MPDAATALVSAGVSAVVSLTVSYLTRRSNQRTAIDGKVLKSIELAMAYPHVEDEDYCKEWEASVPSPGAGASPEERQRYAEVREKRAQYDLYCCFVFNLIEEVWRHCWLTSRISKIVDVREFIETHRCWWESQEQNLFGYDPKFQLYVHSVINDIRKGGRK